MSEEIQNFNKGIIEEFRSNHGKVGGMFEGADLLLLTTVGAKSGQERISPLAYQRDGERMVIIASYGGADRHPAWYHNIVANPKVTVDLGDGAFPATAVVHAEGPERDRLYARMAEAMPQFAEYQQKTQRIIPVVVLEK
ncbi:nitroreductase family deazaflavin-dependent oxidoreductase [Amycolatopsis sp. NPDC059021]|uniref:nitroreductase family deazaflavin-dependent oxidoreductase n=1 Tax=Amycolatopsis sp. NPDC059021 TaxID=3346704 RepID=UPI00366AC628